MGGAVSRQQIPAMDKVRPRETWPVVDWSHWHQRRPHIANGNCCFSETRLANRGPVCSTAVLQVFKERLFPCGDMDGGFGAAL